MVAKDGVTDDCKKPLGDCIGAHLDDRCEFAKKVAPAAKTWMTSCCDTAFDKADADDKDKLETDKTGCKKQVDDRFEKDFLEGKLAGDSFCEAKDTQPAPALEFDIKSAARKTMHVAVWTIVIIVVVSCLCVVGIIYGIYALCCKQADGREVYVAMDAPLVEEQSSDAA